MQDLYAYLVNEKVKNHSLWSIHDGPEDKIENQCYETGREYELTKCAEI